MISLTPTENNLQVKNYFVHVTCIEVCVLLEHVLISYTGGVCYLWVLEASFCEVAVLVLDDVYIVEF